MDRGRVRVRGGHFGNGIRTTPGTSPLSSGRRSPEQACSSRMQQQSETYKPGPQPKRPGVKMMLLGIKLYEDEHRRFKDLAKELKKTDRETLKHLLGIYTEFTSIPEHSTNIPTQMTSTPIRPTKHRRNSDAEESQETGAATIRMASGTLPQGTRSPREAAPKETRRPVYRGASMPAVPSRYGLVDDSVYNDDADVYEFVDEEDSVDEHQLHFEVVDQTRTEPNASLNITDREGNLLEQPDVATALTEEQTARLRLIAQAKEMEILTMDYSDSTRLLPEKFYEKYSENTKCRLYKPDQPDNDALGFVPPTEPKGQRNANARFEDAIKVAQNSRYICELHQLGKLISPKCYRADCDEMNDMENIEVTRYSAVIILKLYCKSPLKHLKVWSSNRRLQHAFQNKSIFYAMNTLLPAAIIVSGNQFQKISQLFKALNIRGIAKTYFCQIQKAIVTPVVREAMDTMQEMMHEKLVELNAKLVVSSDGQSDSPAHSAAYTTYTNMITGITTVDSDGESRFEKTAYIADMTVVEKRHTNLNSNAMEVAGFLLGINSICEMGGTVEEVITDMHKELLHLLQRGPYIATTIQEKGGECP